MLAWRAPHDGPGRQRNLFRGPVQHGWNGRLEDLETTHELVHNFNVRDEWQVAEEPLHSLAESIDEAHWKHATHLLSLWAKPGQKQEGPLVGEDAPRFRNPLTCWQFASAAMC